MSVRAKVCRVFLLIVASTQAHWRLATADEASRVEKESGVRLQLYRLATPATRPQHPAPNQSPNLDRTIRSFELTGEETFWSKVRPPFLAVLTAQFEGDEDEEYHFHIQSNATIALRIDEGELFFAELEEDEQTCSIDLDEGEHEIQLLVVSDSPIELELEWAVENEDFEPIPHDRLSAEAFYFRPTAPGVKQLMEHENRPGLREKVAGLYPSLDITTIHPPSVDVPVGGLATLSDGTLVVAVFDAQSLQFPKPQQEPNGQLWLYHGANGEPTKIRREKIADGLFEPAGVCVVGDSIYLSQRDEITRFSQTENSGQWRAETVATGWETNDFHAISFGLLHEKVSDHHPGYLYMAKGTGLGLKRNPPDHGSVWRVDLSKPIGENVEPITGGHRTPNGLGWGPKETIFVTDNQGEFTPANELNLIREGAFYGFYQETTNGGSPAPFQPSDEHREDPAAVTEAAVWLPQDAIGNSPTQPLMIPEGWPFAGQMLVGDMRYGGIIRVSLDEVGGHWQGAAYRFTQGCEGGVNRLAFGPGGSLYIGAIGGDQTPTWAWVNPEGQRTDQGLQRLNPNGRAPFDIERVTPKSGGFEIRFTKPIASSWLSSVRNYEVEQWTYKATPEYGGPKKDLEQLEVQAAVPTADGKAVSISIDGLKVDRVVHFVVDPASIDGEQIWSAEAWYTLRKRPMMANASAD